MMTTHQEISARLEQIRLSLRAENISYSELAELQGLVGHIDPGDVELLEPAGWPEEREGRWVCGGDAEQLYTDNDGNHCHARAGICQRDTRKCQYPERAFVGKCVDCGLDTLTGYLGCYANRGFGHMRVVGR